MSLKLVSCSIQGLAFNKYKGILLRLTIAYLSSIKLAKFEGSPFGMTRFVVSIQYLIVVFALTANWDSKIAHARRILVLKNLAKSRWKLC